MRVRAMDSAGDFTFGQSQGNFLVNSPQAVAQVIQTTLGLWAGEWFLDQTAGTPYLQKVLGTGKQTIFDQVLQSIILNVQGVLSITAYISTVNTVTRDVTIAVTVQTQYGEMVTSVTV